MPIVETRLWDGATIDWSKQATTQSARCTICGTVHPGRHMVEVENGECQVCRQKRLKEEKHRCMKQCSR